MEERGADVSGTKGGFLSSDAPVGVFAEEGGGRVPTLMRRRKGPAAAEVTRGPTWKQTADTQLADCCGKISNRWSGRSLSSPLQTRRDISSRSEDSRGAAVAGWRTRWLRV